MSTVPDTSTPVELAWQAYEAEERQLRADYLDAVNRAQAHFDRDVKPAMDAYHSAERAAWQMYNMTSRSAKRRYLDITTQLAADAFTPPPPLPVPGPDTPDSPDRGPWAPRPSFTPGPDPAAGYPGRPDDVPAQGGHPYPGSYEPDQFDQRWETFAADSADRERGR